MACLCLTGILVCRIDDEFAVGFAAEGEAVGGGGGNLGGAVIKPYDVGGPGDDGGGVGGGKPELGSLHVAGLGEGEGGEIGVGAEGAEVKDMAGAQSLS